VNQVLGDGIMALFGAPIAHEDHEVALRGTLSHLQVAEFLYEASLFPELEYTSQHVLTREVAYGSLFQERRRALHARIVEAIERLAPERMGEQVERLAHHVLRGEVWGVRRNRSALTRCQRVSSPRS